MENTTTRKTYYWTYTYKRQKRQANNKKEKKSINGFQFCFQLCTLSWLTGFLLGKMCVHKVLNASQSTQHGKHLLVPDWFHWFFYWFVVVGIDLHPLWLFSIWFEPILITTGNLALHHRSPRTFVWASLLGRLCSACITLSLHHGN